MKLVGGGSVINGATPSSFIVESLIIILQTDACRATSFNISKSNVLCHE